VSQSKGVAIARRLVPLAVSLSYRRISALRVVNVLPHSDRRVNMSGTVTGRGYVFTV